MTIPSMIRACRDRWKDRACAMVKRSGTYGEVSWQEFYEQAWRTGLALLGRGLRVGDRVGILSHTCYEWMVSDTAILTSGGITVPLYPTLSRKELKDLLIRSGTRFLFADTREEAEKVLPLLDEIDGLELVLAFEGTRVGAIDDPRLLSHEDFMAEADQNRSKELEDRLATLSGDDLATVIFTSGTTGEPKGVELTHRNILSNIEASLSIYEIGTTDISLAHLPLAHILARTVDYYLMLQAGATVAFAEDLKTVAQNLAEVRPTIAVSVPRIFEKVYAGIQSKAVEASAPIRALTFWALGVGRRAGELLDAGKRLPLGLRIQFIVADHLVYAKVRQKLGGRLRFFVSGGAPLAPELAKFFNAIGVHIYEGYGLTETSPVIAANTPEHNRVGTVGRPLPNVEVRIAEDGEILVRGPSVFRRYYQNEEATREAFTDDGFFKTGDIGELDEDGYLQITDRKKDLIVTAGGKNVAPQKVENVLKLSKYIADAMLYGDRKKFITALIVPDAEWLTRYAEWKKIPHEDLAELVRHPQVVDYYTRLVDETQKKAELASYESVKKFLLLPHEFSAGAGEVTPTMKVRRKQVIEHYHGELEALYEEDEG